MALLPIKIPAGFFRNATQYQAKNRWYKGNLVRFSEGRLRPIGGWQRLADTQIVKKGALKGITITAAGTGYTAGTLSATGGGGGSGFAGTYTVSGSGAILTTTITNYGSGYSTAPTIVISHAGNSNATITAETHGTLADPIRGLHSWRLSTGARYLAVGSTQSLRLWDGSQSSGTNAPIYDITPATGAGPSGSIDFVLQEDFLIPGLGYGALEYGGDRKLDGTGGTSSGGDIYGTPRYPATDPDVTDIDAWRDNFASCWSMDNFGDDLLACHSGEGTIWHWSLATGGSLTKTFTVTSPSVISTLTPVGPTPASIQPTTSGQWECGNPPQGANQVEKTHTNVSQTSTSGSGAGAKFTVVTQLGTVIENCNVWRASTRIDCGDTSNLKIGMLVHGLAGDISHWSFGSFIQPTIASITNSTTVQISSANGSGSGSYTQLHLSFQDPSTYTGSAFFWANNSNISGANSLSANDEVYFTGNFYGITGIVANTTYYVSSSNLSSTVFRVSATPGGTHTIGGWGRRRSRDARRKEGSMLLAGLLGLLRNHGRDACEEDMQDCRVR